MQYIRHLFWYYKFFDEFYRKYPVFQIGFIYDKDGVKLDSIDKESDSIYNMIEYDILHGNNYLYKEYVK